MSVKQLDEPMTRKQAERLCRIENRCFPGHRVVLSSVPGGPARYCLVYEPERVRKGGQ